MAEITIDQTEHQEGEFTADEQDSLAVGEKLLDAQDQLLAGKYKDAEELEKAYIELQGKFSSGEREQSTEDQPEESSEEEKVEDNQEDTPEVSESILDTLYGELGKDGPSKETLEQLNKMNPEDLARMHVQYRIQQDQPQELDDTVVQELQQSVGGEENYSNMMAWANENLGEQEIGMYDHVMAKGDPVACFFAVQALNNRMTNAVGYDGEMIQGKAPKASKGNTFRSQAEVVQAMKDPRYDADPAYRQDVYDKLEHSNLQY